jgi:hypothetical protein
VLTGILALLVAAGCPKSDAPTPSPTRDAPAAVALRDVTSDSGLTYRWEIAGKRPLNILQTIGNGCAFLDYNNDGNLDILLVGPKPALFQGDGKGRFTDVTSTAFGDLSGHFLGVAVGDIDNDGFDDLYLSGFRDGRLLRNESGKRFVDITKASGLKPQPWGTSASFVELEPGSGRLDLVIGNYARFGPEAAFRQLCESKDVAGKPVLTSCGPRQYQPLPAVLYRNLGGGRFAETLLKQTTGRGLGVAAADIDGSGRPSVSFANDEIAGDLLHNLGGYRFKNIAEASSTAYDRDGNVHGGMGTDWGDFDGDGRLDLVVATFQNEPKSLYRNEGELLFSDVAYPAGIGMATAPFVAFGVKFCDLNNDGWLDLVFANGHVQDNIAAIDPSTQYRQAAQAFLNKGADAAGRVAYTDISASLPNLRKPIVGRGLATGDYDNDGKVDLLLIDSEGTPILLHNESARIGHSLSVRLVGKRANRNGYGAIVTATVGGRTIVRHCHADGSYLSSSDVRVHLGLGAANNVETLEVLWPGGNRQLVTNVKTDRTITIREGEAPEP